MRFSVYHVVRHGTYNRIKMFIEGLEAVYSQPKRGSYRNVTVRHYAKHLVAWGELLR